MQSQLTSLSQLFNNAIFRIPDYQRGYAWTKKEYSEFWNDIINFNPAGNYYMGVITTDEIPKEKMASSTDSWIISTVGYKPFYIVDGQQRLTSIILLLSAIIKNKKKSRQEYINYLNIKEITETFLAKPKAPYTNDYTAIFNYDEGSSSSDFFKSKILSLPITDPDTLVMNKYNQNLKDAFEFFNDKVDSLSSNDIDQLYQKITTKILFNIYQISHDINIYVTFETMNNRGKELSTLELLKNRLIYLSTLFRSQAKNSSKKVRSEINKCWKKMYDFLGKNPNHMLSDDDFLIAHTLMYFPKFKYKHTNLLPYMYLGMRTYNEVRPFLLDEYFTAQNVINGTLTPDKILNYIKALNESIKYWYVFNFPTDITINCQLNDDIRVYLMKLEFIKKSYKKSHFLHVINDNWRFISLNYFSHVKDNAKRLSLLKQLENMEFIKLICIASHSNPLVLNMFYDIKVDDKNGIENLPNRIKEVNNKTIQSDEFKKYFVNLCNELSISGFYENDFPTRYVLSEYSIYLSKKAKQSLTLDQIDKLYFGKDKDENFIPTIEHIYPQNVKRGTDWNKYFKKYNSSQKKKIKNSLGNLIILNGAKNGKMSDKSFSDKKNCGNAGYVYGSLDEQNVAQNDVWTLREIKNRGYQIVNFIYERWGLRISKEHRYAFIGLKNIKEYK